MSTKNTSVSTSRDPQVAAVTVAVYLSESASRVMLPAGSDRHPAASRQPHPRKREEHHSVIMEFDIPNYRTDAAQHWGAG